MIKHEIHHSFFLSDRMKEFFEKWLFDKVNQIFHRLWRRKMERK